MEGKRTKKRLNAKLHTLMDFSPEKEEPVMERKQKHKKALKVIHDNMQDFPLNEPPQLPPETENLQRIASEKYKMQENGDHGFAEKYPQECKTPIKLAADSWVDGRIKRSANKLSLSNKKKITATSARHAEVSNATPDQKNPETNVLVDQLSKRLEMLFADSSKDVKSRAGKKKIKKTQKMFLQQSVLFSDSDDQMSDDSNLGKDSGPPFKKPDSAKKVGVNDRVIERVEEKKEMSFNDFKVPVLPKKCGLSTSGGKLPSKVTKDGKPGKQNSKVVKKKLKNVREIDLSFSSSSDEEILQQFKLSDSGHSKKDKEDSDASTAVARLNARAESLLKKRPKKGLKKGKGTFSETKSTDGSRGTKQRENKENEPSEGAVAVTVGKKSTSSESDDFGSVKSGDHLDAVKDVCLQVSLNSSKALELSDSSSCSKTPQTSSEDQSRQSVSSEDTSFKSSEFSASSDVVVSPQPEVKEVSLQVSLSHSGTADSNECSSEGLNVSQSKESSCHADSDSASAVSTNDVSPDQQSFSETEARPLQADTKTQNIVETSLHSPTKDHEILSREVAYRSESTNESKDSSLNPDESIYTTPPDSKPSWESTAIGDALSLKFSDLNLHMSRISSESNKSHASKSPENMKSSPPLCVGEVARTSSYVPDSDSDESAASSCHSNRRQRNHDVPGANESVNEDLVIPESDADSSDDNFEQFLSNVKGTKETTEKEDVEPRKNSSGTDSIDDFIVADSDVESDEDDNSLYRKVDPASFVDWEASDGSIERESESEEENDSDYCVAEDKEGCSRSDKDVSSKSYDDAVFKTAVKTQKTAKPKFMFDDSSDEEVSKTAVQTPKPKLTFDDSSEDDSTPRNKTDSTKYYTPQVRLKKDRGILKDSDGVLFKTPMYVPKKNGSSAATPVHSPIYPISRGGMTTYPSTMPAKCRTEAKRFEKPRPQSAGGTESFLKSLSSDVPLHHRHPDANKYLSSFKANRAELTRILFTLYNDTVFDNKMSVNMEVNWNNRLNKTAGMCRSKRDRTAPNGRVSKIELSTKVCDTAERVRDTLIHEMCHAAVWLIHGEHGGHGPLWKAFATKAARVHTELPPISRCHAYDISYKYIYKCKNCGYQFGRHSKSLDTERKVCGHCRGRFELLVNAQTPAGRTPRAIRTPSKFALFVKENYGLVKQGNKDSNHKDIMQLLSLKFSQSNLNS